MATPFYVPALHTSGLTEPSKQTCKRKITLSISVLQLRKLKGIEVKYFADCQSREQQGGCLTLVCQTQITGAFCYSIPTACKNEQLALCGARPNTSTWVFHGEKTAMRFWNTSPLSPKQTGQCPPLKWASTQANTSSMIGYFLKAPVTFNFFSK